MVLTVALVVTDESGDTGLIITESDSELCLKVELLETCKGEGCKSAKMEPSAEDVVPTSKQSVKGVVQQEESCTGWLD